jgi:hypothetical protein
MKRILSFEDYTNKANEADLFGVTTSGMGNYPAGYEGPEGQKTSKTSEESILPSTI